MANLIIAIAIFCSNNTKSRFTTDSQRLCGAKVLQCYIKYKRKTYVNGQVDAVIFQQCLLKKH